ncbi:MAG TPA: DNA polymerase III subunit epsilon [Alphaproteobacteria bacterium]|nr:DNA polymerase III subunit epsilon [Alphaproteobacteria bacterium]
MREIILDTETTGLDPKAGHRLVEIACIELMNRVPTGNVFHRYANPERDMPAEAFAVHKLSSEFLSDKPLFASYADELIAFIAGDDIVAHNAEFDMRFLNAEFERAGKPPHPGKSIDTVAMARQKYPGQPASLDALCKRLGVDNTMRTVHGALLDAELLAAVYLEMNGGRQHGFALADDAASDGGSMIVQPVLRDGPVRAPRPHAASAAELEAHAAFLGKLKNPIWSA